MESSKDTRDIDHFMLMAKIEKKLLAGSVVKDEDKAFLQQSYQISVDRVAKELSQLFSYTFSSIPIEDLYNLKLPLPESHQRHARAVIALSALVRDQVIVADGVQNGAIVIARWIAIMQKSIEMGNLQGALAIFAGLSDTSVQRLTPLWESLPSTIRGVYDYCVTFIADVKASQAAKLLFNDEHIVPIYGNSKAILKRLDESYNTSVDMLKKAQQYVEYKLLIDRGGSLPSDMPAETKSMIEKKISENSMEQLKKELEAAQVNFKIQIEYNNKEMAPKKIILKAQYEFSKDEVAHIKDQHDLSTLQSALLKGIDLQKISDLMDKHKTEIKKKKTDPQTPIDYKLDLKSLKDYEKQEKKGERAMGAEDDKALLSAAAEQTDKKEELYKSMHLYQSSSRQPRNKPKPEKQPILQDAPLAEIVVPNKSKEIDQHYALGEMSSAKESKVPTSQKQAGVRASDDVEQKEELSTTAKLMQRTLRTSDPTPMNLPKPIAPPGSQSVPVPRRAVQLAAQRGIQAKVGDDLLKSAEVSRGRRSKYAVPTESSGSPQKDIEEQEEKKAKQEVEAVRTSSKSSTDAGPIEDAPSLGHSDDDKKSQSSPRF